MNSPIDKGYRRIGNFDLRYLSAAGNNEAAESPQMMDTLSLALAKETLLPFTKVHENVQIRNVLINKKL